MQNAPIFSDAWRGIRLIRTLDHVAYPLVLFNWLYYSRTGLSYCINKKHNKVQRSIPQRGSRAPEINARREEVSWVTYGVRGPRDFSLHVHVYTIPYTYTVYGGR